MDNQSLDRGGEPSTSALDAAAKPPANSSLVATELDNSFTETRYFRSDGWTSFRRKAFLDDLAERGSVTAACRTAAINARSAYQLRHRDPLFATAWQAALVFAHQRLADDLMDRSISGCIEQIHRDGAIVGERHRHDNKLSIAVLGRLDRQLERAEVNEEAHLLALGQWDAFVDAVAEERTADAEAIIAPRSKQCEVREVSRDISPFSGNLDFDEDDCMDDEDDGARVWVDDHHWRTDFPPPEDFCGDEYGDYGDPDYSRRCTLEETAVLDARYPDDCTRPDGRERERIEDEALRDSMFKSIAEDFAAKGPGSLDDDDDDEDDDDDDDDDSARPDVADLADGADGAAAG